jgi:hypothetical protein
VFALARHEPRAPLACMVFACGFAVAWIVLRSFPDLRRGDATLRVLLQALVAVFAAAALLWLNRYGLFSVENPEARGGGFVLERLAFPWYVPIGSTIAFALGLVLSRQEPATAR